MGSLQGWGTDRDGVLAGVRCVANSVGTCTLSAACAKLLILINDFAPWIATRGNGHVT